MPEMRALMTDGSYFTTSGCPANKPHRTPSVFLVPPASAARVPASESRIKRGSRIVGIDTEIIEKLGWNGPCRAARVAAFRRCCSEPHRLNAVICAMRCLGTSVRRTVHARIPSGQRQAFRRGRPP